ncbi:MAG: hypothetical protein DSY33_03255 [Archaeoglobus sp.]|nr:MAG: hypothetical protein DSY33_03255 [Archaeoglobus sp.]
MNSKILLTGFLLAAVAGIGLSAYMAESSVRVSVIDSKIVEITPTTGILITDGDSYTTKNFTVETDSSKTITVKLKAIPADYSTVKVWGDEFIAVVSPDSVKINSTHSAEVTLIVHSEKPGKYRVKLVAVK